ncbi:MAG: LPS-assembly protein LptD [Lentisphaeria bacterium]|nr:LPS-assembly protein LptD [Lentisphaeria bacterium]
MALLIVSATLLPVSSSYAANFGGSFDTGIESPKRQPGYLQHARADQWRLAGRTLFVKGNVYIPYGNITITADQAMIDLESQDIEAKGNITFYTVKKELRNVTLDEFELLRQEPGMAAEIKGVTVDPLGNQKLQVEIARNTSALQAERMSGNMLTGMITFTDLRLRASNFVCKAKRGMRQPGGELKLEGLEVSSCGYLFEDQSHFSIGMSTANIYPHETEGFGFGNTEKEYNQYSLWGYNTTLRIYGVPVFWLPMLYTPKDESPGLFSTQIGRSSDWGYYVLLSKKFQFTEYPDFSTTLELDFYSKRGIGYGEHTSITTENSRTVINAYGIYDNEPYESSGSDPKDPESKSRFEIPHQRFDLQITHRTHLTPRLDFRAQVEWMSDPYMLEDYFPDRADSVTEPATYAALEYQHDRFSASLYTRFQVNDFYTTLQKMPEGRLDVQRQEILPGSNLYYQGSHTASIMKMNWARFDRKWKNPYGRLKNYESGRFDTVNFLYYPIRTDYINIIPRAGLRLTGYTNTSRKKVRQHDIYNMQAAATDQEDFGVTVRNYDDHGHGKVRFLAEFGVEANTKIYNTWQNVRSDFFGMDGLRHICEPYINYTFITDPTVNRNKLLYFDEADRIESMNFLRLGLRNRLQTRRGGFHDSRVHEWFSMENYWDIHFDDDDDYNHVGDFCTKISLNPVRQLSFTGFMSIDVGGNHEHTARATRGNRDAGRPGMSGSFFNRLYLGVEYKPIEDITFILSYDYRDAYTARPVYSMGSTLTELYSSAFDSYYSIRRAQTFTFGVTAPITPDRKTFASYKLEYDLEEGGFTRQAIAISRLFHCVRLSALVEFERTREDDGEVEKEISFSVYASLVGWEHPLNRISRDTVSKLTEVDE